MNPLIRRFQRISPTNSDAENDGDQLKYLYFGSHPFTPS
jgi:hypothetical protein